MIKKTMEFLLKGKIMTSAVIVFLFGFFIAGVTDWLKTGLVMMVICAAVFMATTAYLRSERKNV